MTGTAVKPLPHRRVFLARLSRGVLAGVGVIAVSLFAGMAGYHWLEHLGWLDSYLNAAMLLSGMGPLWSPISDAGKVFAGAYALYSGVAVLAFAGVVLAPLGHRLLHKFHAADDDAPAAPRTPRKGSKR
jgi:hypothetical protein